MRDERQKPLSDKGRENWDKIFKKDIKLRTPEEWAAEDGLIIADPDGWRFDRPQFGLKARSFTDPITKDEFRTRCIFSTLLGVIKEEV